MRDTGPAVQEPTGPCVLCGHAVSRHTSLGYCRATSTRDGECTCDSTRARGRGGADTAPPPCPDHKEVQHRDGNPPWCETCGWNHGRPAIPARQIQEPR